MVRLASGMVFIRGSLSGNGRTISVVPARRNIPGVKVGLNQRFQGFAACPRRWYAWQVHGCTIVFASSRPRAPVPQSPPPPCLLRMP